MKKSLMAVVILLNLWGESASAAEPGDCPRALSLEKTAIETEAVCLLQKYVRIDTTNPPGNELATARFLAAFLHQEGIEATLFESAPGRANLYARLRGDGSRKALMLVHHMDVVPAVPGEWQKPPFAAVREDGYLWGRGTLDDKGPGIMEALAFVMLKRLSIPLARDVVLLGVADEEQGGAQGARFMMNAHFALFKDVEFALNEGGGMLELADKRMLYAVEFAQKVPLWLEITANGPAGHASLPRHEAATHRLVRALSRLERFEFPIIVVPEVQKVFAQRVQALPETERGDYQNLAQSLKNNSAFRKTFMSDPHRVVMVRNSLAITMLTGSGKENVYPAQAKAVLDLRLLPDQDPQAVIATLAKVMNESEVNIRTLLSSQAHASPIDTALYRAIGALIQRHDAHAQITPNFIAGFTDCNTFRSKGIVCYGFMPEHLPIGETERIHGRDERIAVEDLTQATLLLHELVRDVAGH